MGSSPMFPTLIQKVKYNKYAYLINHINIALSKKMYSITVLMSVKVFRLLKLLHRLGIVSRYFISDNEGTLKITMTFFKFKGSTYFSKIRQISTPSKKHYITYRSLLLVRPALKSSFMILSTSEGLITHKEALSRKVGGLMLCFIC